MPIETWLAYVAAAGILLIIPGPTILTVIGYSLSHGRRAGIPLAAAVALGDSTALVLSIAGLGALLLASSFWFVVIKWIGGAYLIILGLRMLRAARQPATLSAATPADSLPRLFANTYLVTALNPKGIVFFIAFLPQFIDPHGDYAAQLAILGTTFVTLAAFNAAGYAYFAGTARQLLASPRLQRGFNLCGGGLLTAAGLWALLAKKPA